jgi:5-hydroxyisourate hydrolase-like protein (transthyretin family)
VNLNAGSYNVQLTSGNYGSKYIYVVVKKSTPTLKASKKTFKLKKKTKKYTVTFKLPKRNLNHYKLTLKVKGKTYKAYTNSKGKATFKITKLNKKGKFTAKITFKTNKYYKGVSKKVKLTIK